MPRKRVAQFRFFGDSNSDFNTSDQNAIYHQMDDNNPATLSSMSLIDGSIFEEYTPIIQLGIQSLPGLKFNINTNLDPIIMGASGMFEIDLVNSSAYITSLTFDKQSLESINENPDGYLIIDIVYEEG